MSSLDTNDPDAARFSPTHGFGPVTYWTLPLKYSSDDTAAQVSLVAQPGFWASGNLAIACASM